LSFEQLYRNAYSIVSIQRAEELYERTKELEKEWLCGEVQKRVVAAITPRLLLAKEAVDMQDQVTEATERRETGERFLSALKEAWEDHQICMKMITDVLMYMVSQLVCADWIPLTQESTHRIGSLRLGKFPYTPPPWHYFATTFCGHQCRRVIMPSSLMCSNLLCYS
jgi:hypothetical protein